MNQFDMELTRRQAQEYQKASKKQRGEILTRYCGLTGVGRNLASKRFCKVIRDIYPRVLKGRKFKRPPGRSAIYIEIHKQLVHRMWELSSEICAERLHPVIREYLEQLDKSGELKNYEDQVIIQVRSISQATLKRIISEFPKVGKRNGSKGNASIYKAIPVKAHFGDNADKSGYVEVDYVEHNGGNSSGTFISTGCYVDVGLGWIARAAALSKSLQAVSKIHDMNEPRIHHQIQEYHPDNAKPILSLLLQKTLGDKPAGFALSRSRPYKKEDNGHVEQKNGDKVRNLVGYHRYDTPVQVALLNQLYEVEDMISNFFLPSQKLVEKFQDAKGKPVRRKHDIAKTAYWRLMAAKDINAKTKKKVTKIYQGLNLIQLRQQSEELQKKLFRTVI